MKKYILIAASAAFTVMSCSEQELNEELQPIEAQSMETEVAFQNESGSVQTTYYCGSKLSATNINDQLVVEGDIILPPNQTSSTPLKLVYEKGEECASLKSTGRTNNLWPDKTVYYSIANNLPNKNRVYDAIEHWESLTTVKFVERTNQSNYVYFQFGDGCSSYVGMIGGRQNITLANGCSTGNTIHEIGHALGLWHEQSRADRNQHVIIEYDNIESYAVSNFYTYVESGMDGDDYTTFDFGSIMMYGPYAFSKNGKATITKTDGSIYQSQRNGLSSRDVEGINKMYPSGGGTVTYENGNYYTIYGVKVYRYNNKWYYYDTSKSQWREVELVGEKWYYA